MELRTQNATKNKTVKRQVDFNNKLTLLTERLVKLNNLLKKRLKQRLLSQKIFIKITE